MKKIIKSTLALGVILIIIITGCEKNTTLIIKPVPVVVSDSVSFSKDLIPIFTKECAKSGCHAEGAHEPILVASKAYNSLINDPDFVIVSDPEGSTLYKRLTGALSPQMPMGSAKNPSNINALVLAWITQGALNN